MAFSSPNRLFVWSREAGGFLFRDGSGRTLSRVSGRRSRVPECLPRAPERHSRGPECRSRGPECRSRGPECHSRGPECHSRGSEIRSRGPEYHSRGPEFRSRAAFRTISTPNGQKNEDERTPTTINKPCHVEIAGPGQTTFPRPVSHRSIPASSLGSAISPT